MANVDWNGIEAKTVTLARTILQGYVQEATSGMRAFQAEAQAQIDEWLEQLRNHEITEKNFRSLVRGERDLAEMQALKQAGLTQVAIDTFTRGFMEIIVNAAIAAI
jgi:hypothetical protein